VFAALGLVPPPSEVLAMHEMTFEVIEPPAPVEPPKPEPPPPPPPPEPERERAKAPAPKAEPEPVEAPPENAKPAADEVTDFTGETLTAGDGSGSWSTVVGSGGQLKGPVGKIKPGTTGDVQQSAKVAPSGPRVVALASLARKPAPPSGLDELLQRGFPSRARMQGVGGIVVTRLRILPSGRVGKIEVVKESPPGFDFGTACRDMLEHAPGGVPPLYQRATPVASDVTFTCRYEVND
jgi:protein TonB